MCPAPSAVTDTRTSLPALGSSRGCSGAEPRDVPSRRRGPSPPLRGSLPPRRSAATSSSEAVAASHLGGHQEKVYARDHEEGPGEGTLVGADPVGGPCRAEQQQSLLRTS